MTWPRAVLLDFYGTVVEEDVECVHEACVAIAKAAETPTVPEEVGRYWQERFNVLCFESIGPTFRSEYEIEVLSIEHVLRQFRVPLNARELAEPLFKVWRRPRILPHSREAIAAIPVPVCLVSNVDNPQLAEALEFNSLSFDLIVTSEDCRAYKPHPEMFLRALEMLGMTPGEVLHVGDSLTSDVQGAQALGIPAMWINRDGRDLPEGVKPEYEARDLREVMRLFSGVRG
jgi:2-haloacid dehalogenase/putative hydrolase of the HAD superfamily